jgi:ankyrin repeat protein
MTMLKEEMSTMQVAALLNQARLCDAKNQTKTMRRSSISGTRSSFSADASLKSQPPTSVNHIQGQSQASEVGNSAVSPTILYNDILVSAGFTPHTIACADVKGFFLRITSDRLNCYSKDIIGAITSSDLNFLRMAHTDLNRNMNCCNRFGETVLHTACRLGQLEVVKFLVNEAKVDVRVRDDYGRTPAHDACWQAEPNMELIEIIVNQCPDLLLVTDKRGFTPLQYVRKAQWPAWAEVFKKNQFLPKRLWHAGDSNLIAVSA